MSNQPAQEFVGPVFEKGELAEVVLGALVKLNPGLRIQDRGSYVRVLVPNRCLLTRFAVEEILGRPFQLPRDLELIMPSFKGTFRVSEEEAEWTAGGIQI